MQSDRHWEEFLEWVKRIEEWNCPELGRYAGRVPTKPVRDVALRVMNDLVAWSIEPPQVIREKWPQAAFGLAGIGTYAATCENVQEYQNLAVCHDINGQWGVRNSSGVHLGRVADEGMLPTEVNTRLRAASQAYRAAYESWQAFYNLLGHRAAGQVRTMKARRLAGAAVVRAWLEHEKAALAEIEAALSLLA